MNNPNLYNQGYGNERYMQGYMQVPPGTNNVANNPNLGNNGVPPGHYGMVQNNEAYYYNSMQGQNLPYIHPQLQNMPISQVNPISMLNQHAQQMQSNNMYQHGGNISNLNPKNKVLDMETLFSAVNMLLDPATCKLAVPQLLEYREDYDILGPMVWYSFGAMSVLMQEIFKAYPNCYGSTLGNEQSVHIGHVLTLLQVIATCERIRPLFVTSAIPHFLLPFLTIPNKLQPIEHIRTSTLGVFGALVKCDDLKIVEVLIKMDFLPIVLKLIETKSYGADLTKTIGLFILGKLLNHKTVFDLVLNSQEYYYFTISGLLAATSFLKNEKSFRLYKQLLKVYIKLCESAYVRKYLQLHLPECLRDNTFSEYYEEDESTRNQVQNLLHLINSEK
ncbi:Rcd1-domain-containing protein [Neoconidiobolus thromboides FSU 785]|nr:Rcd1-domain-containing protein [Neoconidiobolus thromboides FSU 785]